MSDELIAFKQTLAEYLEGFSVTILELQEETNYYKSILTEVLDERDGLDDKIKTTCGTCEKIKSILCEGGFIEGKKSDINHSKKAKYLLEKRLIKFKKIVDEFRGIADKNHEVISANSELSGKVTDLKGIVDKLEHENERDALTKIYNRRKYDDDLGLFIEDLEKNNKSFSLMVIDIDDFKNVNSVYGHAYADKVLSGLAGNIRLHLDKNLNEHIYRYGGEEFVIISERSAEDLKMEIDNVLTFLKGKSFKGSRESDPLLKLTFSAGVSDHSEILENKDSYFKVSDEKLYIAKSTGKNKIVI